MCGIVGFFNKKEKEYDLIAIENMVKVQKHRGPDDEGICLVRKGQIIPDRSEAIDGFDGAFGFSRLSILDLSLDGHQPMMNGDETVMIIFNGEVYNAFDYKEELQQKGYLFRSMTDTEIVLNLYLEYGIEMVNKLNGMFAFAIYDSKKNSVFLARDRFGIKPLYLYSDYDIVLFASEIKSIIASKKMTPGYDLQGIKECIAFGNTYERTLLKGIRSLRPGVYYEISLSDYEIHATTYFDINSYHRPVNTTESFEEAKSRLDKVIRECVKRQLRSDVKIGCQLSGGVDSSTVSYYAMLDGEVKIHDAVAVIFENNNKRYSEEKYIDEANGKLKFNVHKCVLNKQYFLNNIEHICWALDGIPGFHNEIGILLMAEEAKKHLTVLLSGEGADEILAGYDRLAASEIISLVSNIRAVVPKRIKRKLWGENGKKYTFEEYVVFKDAVSDTVLNKVFHEKDILRNVGKERCKRYREMSGTNTDRQIKYEMDIRLQGLLNRQDKSTMAKSIENRVPFLDNEMVDYAFSIPRRFLVKFDVYRMIRRIPTKVKGKFVLKSLCSDIYGDKFTYRKKCGFEIPIRDWIQDKYFKKYVSQTIIPSMRKRGLMDIETIESWVNELDRLAENEMIALWRCLTIEIFLRMFVDRIPAGNSYVS